MKKSVQIILIIVGVLLIILIPVLLYTKLNNDYQKLVAAKKELYFKEIQALMERYHEEVGIEC